MPAAGTTAAALAPLPPGPRAPAAWQLLRYTRTPLTFLEACARRFGDPFTMRLAGYGPFVLLADPEAVRDVFRGDGRALHSGEGNEWLATTVGRSSVLVLDEQPHARQRRVLLPPLKGERMRAWFDAMQAATLDELSALPQGRPVPMLEPMRCITARVILQSVVGLPSGPRLQAFERLVHAFLDHGRSAWSLILTKTLPLGLMRRIPGMPYFREMAAVDRALFELLAERRRQPADARGSDVVAELLAATYEDGQPVSDGEIRDALFTLILAGHETTSLALAWTLERTVSHPAVVERIEAELQSVTGGAPPRADQLGALEYLDAVIREGLRVRTILPFVVRLTQQPFVAGGREYPAGVLLAPCNHLVHLRPDLYPQPQVFRPERFLERSFGAHEWFPFGGGNRSCLGMAFALYEMKVVLATLFATRRLSRPKDASSHPVRRGITLAPHDGALMAVAAR